MKHKKCIRKLLSFLTIVCCLAGSITPVHASGTGNGSNVPRVTFTNEPVNSPDLYVSKTVENALEGAQYAAPEHAVFRFVLKQNGQIAAGVTYRVLDSEHGEIIRKTSTGMNDPFRTDRTGVFTLEAGQQAWFEGLGTGARYEVTEQDTYLLPVIENGVEKPTSGSSLYYVTGEGANRIETPFRDQPFEYETRSLAADGWQKKSPAGGSTGEQSVLPNGSHETFTNRYIGKGTGDTTTLEISKTAVFPSGYQAPDTTPAFPFVIELDGAPYANEPFTAVNERTGETRSLTTDGEGRFTLPGGWTARFEKVPVDVDYKVYEDTEAVYEEEGAEEIPGQTPIRDANMSVLSLDRAENLLSQAGQSTAKLLSQAGSDSLAQPGQSMLDGGLQTGGATDTGNILSMWPEDWWPTQDTVRTGATQAPLTAVDFQNSNVSFVVTKRLEDYSTPENTVFQFRLADENNNAIEGAEYYCYKTTGEPVYKEDQSGGILRGMVVRPGGALGGPAVLVDGKQITTGRTYYDGSFTLAPGEAAVFVGLKPGTSYRVSETETPEYIQIAPPRYAPGDPVPTVPENGAISFVNFVNRPVDNEGVLTVTKNVTYGFGEGELSEDEFHFILYKRLTPETAKTLFGVNDVNEITLDAVKAKLKSGEILLAEVPTLDMGDMSRDDFSLDLDAALRSADGDGNTGLMRSKSRNRMNAGGNRNSFLPDLWFFEQGGVSYEVYVPAEGMLFSIPEGTEAPTYKTGPYRGWERPGEFVLKAGQTARFEDKVSTWDGYLAMEVDLSEEYEEMTGRFPQSDYRPVYSGLNEDGTLQQTGYAQAGLVQEKIMSDESEVIYPGGLALNFENSYIPKKIDLVLTKTDGENQTIADREAHFMLYRTKGQDSPVLPELLEDGTVPDPDTYVYRTEKGVLTIPNLKAGTYWLRELKAPSGYCLLPEPIEIELAWTADGLTVTIDGKAYRGSDDAETVKSNVLGSISITPPEQIQQPGPGSEDFDSGVFPPTSMLSAEGGTGRAIDNGNLILRPVWTNTKVNLSIRNTELYELPNSGGIGIYWYSIGGTLLMLAEALILYKNKRRGGVE